MQKLATGSSTQVSAFISEVNDTEFDSFLELYMNQPTIAMAAGTGLYTLLKTTFEAQLQEAFNAVLDQDKSLSEDFDKFKSLATLVHNPLLLKSINETSAGPSTIPQSCDAPTPNIVQPDNPWIASAIMTDYNDIIDTEAVKANEEMESKIEEFTSKLGAETLNINDMNDDEINSINTYANEQ